MSGEFAERRIDAEGTPIRCLEGGEGATVVSLHAEPGAPPTALERLLAEKFRVVALESAAFAAAARFLAPALTAAGIGNHALIASGAAAAAALRHAAGGGTSPEALVLVAPTGDVTGADLGGVKAPTLILVGTKERMAAETAARLCAERIPEAYPMLVYDAGAAMANERPAALFEAVADFLERRGRFILEREESAIHP